MLLLYLLREHKGRLMADFRRFYGISINSIRDEAGVVEFAAMAAHLPRESACWAAINGKDVQEWTLEAQILASVANSLALLWWAQTEDGQKNRERPDMIYPPWVEDPTKETTVFGSDPVPIDEMRSFLGW